MFSVVSPFLPLSGPLSILINKHKWSFIYSFPEINKLHYLERKLYQQFAGFMVLYRGRIGIRRCWSLLWGRTPEKRQNNHRSKATEPTTNSTRIWHRARIEPGTHKWKFSSGLNFFQALISQLLKLCVQLRRSITNSLGGFVTISHFWFMQ